MSHRRRGLRLAGWLIGATLLSAGPVFVGHADVALAAASGPAAAATGGISLKPATVDDSDPATRSYFKPVVPANTSHFDAVIVGNTSNAPIQLLVNAVDGLTGVTSGAVYANRQDRVRRAGAWIQPAVSTLTVGPKSETQVSFTVHVPAHAAPGDYLAGVAFENAHPRTSSSGVSVTEVIRSVIGVQIQVPGPTRVAWSVTHVGIEAAPGLGTASVIVGLANTGQRLAKPHLTVRLTGPGGYSRIVDRDLDTVLPGDAIDYPLAWPDTLRAGGYQAHVTLSTPGASANFNATVKLGASVRGASPVPAPSRPKSQGWLAESAIAALPVATLVGVGTGRRSRRSRHAPRHAARRGKKGVTR